MCQWFRCDFGTPTHKSRRHVKLLGRRGTEDLTLQYACVAHALDVIQGDHCTLSDTVACWLYILEHFPWRYKKQFSQVQDRSKLCLEDGVYLAAHVLDHRYEGVGLSTSQLQLARAYIASDVETQSALGAYLAREPPFDQALFKLTNSPLSWWSSGERMGFPPKLVAVAKLLHVALASSAAIERSFSTLRLTYGHLRGRLSMQKKRADLHFCTDS